MAKQFLSSVFLLTITATAAAEPPRVRARVVGVAPGMLQPGPRNAITDVAGVAVGHVTRIEGADVRTGVTAILPHAGNLFQDKVPAGVAVANGFGKLTGTTQITELGEIETPIILTNTLSVPQAADALIGWTLAQPGNENVASVNPVVGETNDSRLNNIRRRVITSKDVLAAISAASTGAVTEGAVGAGTGTVAFGWKGGIGTSSRVVPGTHGEYRVGVIVQSNYGGSLRVLGTEVGDALRPAGAPAKTRPSSADGSIMIIVATDAPLSDRNLKRLAERSFAGLARTGSAFSNGSGDYAIAFSTALSVRRTPQRRAAASATEDVPNDRMSDLFVAAADATEEAIYNSLFMATPMTGRDSNGDAVVVEAVPIEMVRRRLP
ncbi:P1 family peptidase [Polymorphobacter fuscus]|uniref:S58 family peptidase n=1 Tax=Sandarakinorhabdus fusca TaxID=1439888 RepID=A0A7C9KMG0_9SPHN|nr:P1 family peptidase [Polymorphobacter fuscus]KAB7647674.1 P1 family peptidase [Polymorphobacter fuscus]MQT16964.1 S58 family peptidase [Polymorphobacter fuscus]NJC09046.1 D-aminopeptidase [Polymorphobacter fuscus]